MAAKRDLEVGVAVLSSRHFFQCATGWEVGESMVARRVRDR